MEWPSVPKEYYGFLALLLAADGAFMLLYLVHASRLAAGDPRFSLEEDRGFAEVFQYVKLFWTAALLAALLLRTRILAYAPWSLLFGYLMLDDSVQIHERLGEWVATRFGFGAAMGLRPQDFGEWTVSAAVLCGFLVLLGAAYARARPAAMRVSAPLFGLLLALVVVGVAFDALHVALRSLANTFLVLAEDGGEMIVVSVTCWYTYATWTASATRVGPPVASQGDRS